MVLEKRVGKRKTLTIDRATANTIKDLASRHGLTISSYMKKLIDRVTKIEELGFFAPTALDDLYTIYTLTQFGFVPIPLEFVDRGIDSSKARSLGMRIGSILKELGIDVENVIETLSRLYRVAIPSGDRLIIISAQESLRPLTELIKGIAIGGSLEVEESGGVFSIRIRRGVEKHIV